MTIDERGARLLGAPWKPRGRGEDGALDCLGLALVLVDDPPPDIVAQEFDPAELADTYEPVSGELQAGDLLLSHAIRKGRRIAHLAVVSEEPGWAWTTTEATGVAKVRLSSLPLAKPYRRR
jgi:hypothetical protein